MGFLADLLGNAAVTGEKVIGSSIEADQKEKQARLQSELRMSEQKAAEQLREEFAQAQLKRTRDQDMADSAKINEATEGKRVSRAQSIINSDTGIQHTPEEVKNIIADPKWVENYGANYNTASGNPTEWTPGGGLINPTTSITPATDRTDLQRMRDQADSARGIGRMDMAKEADTAFNAERQAVASDNLQRTQAEANRIKDKESERREQADRGREESSAERTAAILEAANIREDKKASKEDKDRATLNLNTTVLTAEKTIDANQKAREMLDPKKAEDAPKIAALDAETAIARELKTMSLSALKGTLSSGAYKGGRPSAAPPDGAVPIGRTPTGETVYRTKDGKQVTMK